MTGLIEPAGQCTATAQDVLRLLKRRRRQEGRTITATTLRPLDGLTPAETAVIVAATRVVDGDAGRYPFLTAAINALHVERAAVITDSAFHARMVELAPRSRAADALRRSQWTAHELLFELAADDVYDTPGTGWHCWAIWYLTCMEFGVEPPWAAGLQADRRFLEQLDYERAQIKARQSGSTVPG